MKAKLSLLLIGFLIMNSVKAENNNVHADTVEIIKDFKNVYKYQNFYICGQPTLEALKWFRDKKVAKVINLRSKNENQKYTDYAYNEKNTVTDLGLEYYSLPVEGKADYTPEKLEEFIGLILKDKPTVIHCASAGRATYFFMAYLIKAKGYSVEKAVEVGKSIKFSMPIDNLLKDNFSEQIIH